MDFSDIVSITGLPGLYRVINRRQDGMIVSGLGDDKSRFVSARVHMFTPLENITIFTEDDPIDLKDVLIRMKDRATELPPVDAKATKEDMRVYFESVVPEHDRERVYTSDIKKVLKWYAELDQSEVLDSLNDGSDQAEGSDEDPEADESAPEEEAAAEESDN